MATQSSGFAISLTDFAASLLSQRGSAQRARLIAEQVRQSNSDCDVVVYAIEGADEPRWVPKAILGELNATETDLQSGTLGALAESPVPLVLSGEELAREEYGHLDVRRTLASLAYIPLAAEGVLVGAIEVVSYTSPASASLLAAASAVAQLAGPAMASAIAEERERNSSLQSITRVTQMYDLEKVFNSNLDMDSLLATIAAKVQEVMNVQAANVWMVEGDGVTLIAREGSDPTCELGQSQGPGDGVAGKISDDGEAVLIDDAGDERLRSRNAKVQEGAVFSLLALPLMDRESLVGVIEVVNRLDGQPFDEDDQFVLSNVCETASNALHNASLLQAERKVEILEALVRVSSEITSTLDLSRVLQSVINSPAQVIPYERASIALEERGQLRIRTVSGMQQVNAAAPEVHALQDMLEWAGISDKELFIVQRGDEVDDERETTRAKFHEYFAASGMRAFYATPLADDQGRLGILCFESSDPDFLSEAHLEMVRVLAAQATVAIRNASLYKEVPLIGVLEPLLAKKRRFLALEKRRRAVLVAAAAAVAVFLAIFPIPMRVQGDATVAPVRSAMIQPEVEGVIGKVLVREGDPVQPGTVVAQLEDWNYRAALSAAQARYETALVNMNHALAQSDSSEAGVQRIEAEYWKSEVDRARERLDKTQLRSPIAGWVATPHIEDQVGRRFAVGDTVAEVVNNSRVTVDVRIAESDAALLRSDQPAAVKLESFPLHTFHGRVAVISPKSQAQGDERLFFARVSVPNRDGLIRAGMQGQAKVSLGWRPVGYVLFRHPGLWIYDKLWSWFGW